MQLTTEQSIEIQKIMLWQKGYNPAFGDVVFAYGGYWEIGDETLISATKFWFARNIYTDNIIRLEVNEMYEPDPMELVKWRINQK
jgi:hypothetical protein